VHDQQVSEAPALDAAEVWLETALGRHAAVAAGRDVAIRAFRAGWLGRDRDARRAKAEIDSLRDLATELWRARRNMAFGPAGETALLAEFPWLQQKRTG
jgi:hypothetical protein